MKLKLFRTMALLSVHLSIPVILIGAENYYGSPTYTSGSNVATTNGAAASTNQASSKVSSTGTQASAEDDQISAWAIETAQAAQDYAETLDKGNYDQSWDKSDSIFQNVMPKHDWVETLNISRRPYGRAQSRRIDAQRLGHDPKGLPKGAYMVVEFQTNFSSAPNSKELLTLRRGFDGKWRILTYNLAAGK